MKNLLLLLLWSLLAIMSTASFSFWAFPNLAFDVKSRFNYFSVPAVCCAIALIGDLLVRISDSKYYRYSLFTLLVMFQGTWL